MVAYSLCFPRVMEGNRLDLAWIISFSGDRWLGEPPSGAAHNTVVFGSLSGCVGGDACRRRGGGLAGSGSPGSIAACPQLAVGYRVSGHLWG
jgi:hypothetical protein